ncbi:MAG: ATP-binding cassette domain-containing protein [Ruminococcaceae bacterium]|nr:ATP-binding cassette domain-containing protein [Oscillospiraceae bacterium]
MVYLQTFKMPTQDQEEDFFLYNSKAKRTCYDSHYPFGLFKYKELPEFWFDDITIFYGNNGSGKSTLLNVIAEKLRLDRNTPHNKTDFFADYIELSDYTLERSIPTGSKIITSDDVFEKVLDIRRLNDGIDDKRAKIIQEYIEEVSKEEPNRLRGLDDFDRWKRISDMRNPKKSQSWFIRKNLMRNVQERSNGESALAYFVDSIQDDTLYLLDEPENSLSAENQLNLKYFIEDCIRNHGCQFVISTHSPFLLSIKKATIYDIDTTPVEKKDWTDLESVRIYFEFFKENERKFDKLGI